MHVKFYAGRMFSYFMVVVETEITIIKPDDARIATGITDEVWLKNQAAEVTIGTHVSALSVSWNSKMIWKSNNYAKTNPFFREQLLF